MNSLRGTLYIQSISFIHPWTFALFVFFSSFVRMLQSYKSVADGEKESEISDVFLIGRQSVLVSRK